MSTTLVVLTEDGALISLALPAVIVFRGKTYRIDETNRHGLILQRVSVSAPGKDLDGVDPARAIISG